MDLRQIQIKDILNESFVLNESSIVADSYSYYDVTRELTLDIDEILANSVGTVSFEVKITKKGNYTNVAEVFIYDLSAVGVPVESNVTRVHMPELNVTKTLDPVHNHSADVGEVVGFIINITNTGDADINNLTVSEVIPQGFRPDFDWSEGSLVIVSWVQMVISLLI